MRADQIAARRGPALTRLQRASDVDAINAARYSTITARPGTVHRRPVLRNVAPCEISRREGVDAVRRYPRVEAVEGTANVGAAQGKGRSRPRPTNKGSTAPRSVRLARPPSRSRTGLLVGIAVIVVLAVIVAVGVILTRKDTSPTAQIPVQRVSVGYPATVQGGVVVAGTPGASTTVDAYEDFLCPVCGVFEAQHAAKIEQALGAGRITVRYHVLNLLDRSSNPPGYSLAAANAGLCAADAGIFPSYHASLYAAQPREGLAGYTADQLVALGRDLGAPAGFEQCVRTGAHNADVQAQLAGADAALQSQGGFQGTPTVLVNGKSVSVLTPDGSAQFDQLIGQG